MHTHAHACTQCMQTCTYVQACTLHTHAITPGITGYLPHSHTCGHTHTHVHTHKATVCTSCMYTPHLPSCSTCLSCFHRRTPSSQSCSFLGCVSRRSFHIQNQPAPFKFLWSLPWTPTLSPSEPCGHKSECAHSNSSLGSCRRLSGQQAGGRAGECPVSWACTWRPRSKGTGHKGAATDPSPLIKHGVKF
jgi:hypothetical protein